MSDRPWWGAAGVDVGRVGLGFAAFGNLYRETDDAAAVATVDAALDAGIRLFDTAPLYGHGLSEQRLGRCLAGRPGRDDLVVCTKVGRLLVPGTDPESIFVDVPPVVPSFDFSADGVRRSLEESLERLGLDRVDLVHVHDPDDHLEQALTEALPALIELRDAGVIGAVGVGTNTVEVAAAALDRVDIDAVLLAGRITLLDRSGVELAARCAARGVGLLAAGVFNSGILAATDPSTAHFHYAPATAPVIAATRAMRAVTDAAGVDLAAAAIGFPARVEGVSMVLTGSGSPAEVRANAALAETELPSTLWADLDAALASVGWSSSSS